jgi:hypothetical protein
LPAPFAAHLLVHVPINDHRPLVDGIHGPDSPTRANGILDKVG